MPMSVHNWLLSTEDTRIALSVQQHDLLMTRLGGANAMDDYNWTSDPVRIELPVRLDVDRIRTVPVWAFVGARVPDDSGGGNCVELTFRDAGSGAEARSVWTAHDGPGPVQHELFIDNKTGKTLTVYSIQSLELMAAVPEGTDVFYVNKDRSAAAIVASMRSGYGTYTEPLYDRYAMDVWTKTDDDDTGFVPLVLLQSGQRHGMYVGWAWNHGRIAVRGVRSGCLRAEIRAGLFDDFSTDLEPDEVFEVPAAFVGTYAGDIDDGSNRLRKWLFRHMMPEVNRSNENLPYVNWNAFYNTAVEEGAWVCAEQKYYPMVDAVAEVGVEEVTVDVGWWEQYGDWRGSSERWPRGMASASGYAHERNMAFTLYFTFTSGKSAHPEALSSAGPECQGDWFLDDLKADFGIPECLDFVQARLSERFEQFDIDGLRTDYDPIVNRKAPLNKHQGVNDGAYWAEKGFLKLLDHMYATRPGFRYQNCSGGGALKGYALMKRSCTVQVTDSFDALNMRKAVWDSSYCFPMMQIMTQFGDRSSGGAIGEASYRLRTYLMAAPSAHIELPTGMTAEERALMIRLVDVYKTQVRPLIRHADVYHTLPRPDGTSWDGLQLYDPGAGKGLTMVFKPDSDTDTWQLRWRGLEAETRYEVTFCDGTNAAMRVQGEVLMRQGIPVALKGRYVAEWVFIEAIG